MEDFDETIEYSGNTIGERVRNENNSKRLEQLYMEPVSRPPRQFKVIISCHGSYPMARTQDQALIQQLHLFSFKTPILNENNGIGGI